MFPKRGSYQGRCSAAVVQHISGLVHYKLRKQMYKSSPSDNFAKSYKVKRK